MCFRIHNAISMRQNINFVQVNFDEACYLQSFSIVVKSFFRNTQIQYAVMVWVHTCNMLYKNLLSKENALNKYKKLWKSKQPKLNTGKCNSVLKHLLTCNIDQYTSIFWFDSIRFSINTYKYRIIYNQYNSNLFTVLHSYHFSVMKFFSYSNLMSIKYIS